MNDPLLVAGTVAHSRSRHMPRILAPRILAPPILARLLVVASAAACTTATAQSVVDSEQHRFRVVTVVSGLEHPWGLAFLPDGDLLVTEKEGRVRWVHAGQLQRAPVPGGPRVTDVGQGGLLDVALHPRFAENRLVYFTYSKPGERGNTTALARARWENGRLEGLADVFVADAWSRSTRHFGSRIVFDRQGMVYFGVGERNEKTPAQDLGSDKGKILRLFDDGRIPPDNPFVARAGAKPEIWSFGHRNPQGMTLHPRTGELWESEHGARGGDEINRVERGRNYGWPRITHGVDYSGASISSDTARPGMEQPVLHWTPSIAPSGLAIYDGDRFPRWRGNVFSGALAGAQLRRVELQDGRAGHQEVLLEGTHVRTVLVGPDGLLYLLTDDGRVVKLEPAG